MMEVDSSIATLAQIAGLKRLQARANGSNPNPSSNQRKVCFSFAAYARNVIDHLKKCQIDIAAGLSEYEFLRIETELGFTFPPDLRAILQQGLPLGPGFINWRSTDYRRLKTRIDLPIAGLCYEVANGRFWWKKWGSKPKDIDEAVQTAAAALKQIPPLVPIYSHCYIPSSPNLAGNPVFFVYQKDVFYCGFDVADFFQREAFLPKDHPCSRPDLDDLGCGNINQEDVSKGLESVKRRLKNLKASMIKGKNFESLFRSSESYSRSAAAKKGGLRLESAIRSAEASPRTSTACLDPPRKSVDVIFSREKYLQNRSRPPLPKNGLTNFTIAAPAWAAKTARRIDFWSELVEKRLFMKAEDFLCSDKLDIDLKRPIPPRKLLFEEKSIRPKWLNGYLQDMAGRLRNGGWKEEEIVEMMEIGNLNPAENFQQDADKESFLDGLASEVEKLSISLQNAGWSLPDIVDALGCEHGRYAKIAPFPAAAIPAAS